MKYLRKLIALVFILPVVFIMVGCAGPQSTAPANPGQVEETLPDNSSESSSDNSSEVGNDEAVNDENDDDDNQPENTEPSDENADDQKPAEPSQPEEPGTPSQPIEPDSSQDDNVDEDRLEGESDKTDTDNPESPAEPETPVEPEEPAKPETPVEPEEPVEPSEPEIPVEPEEPEKPESPVEPEEPIDENKAFKINFEITAFDSTMVMTEKIETPMSISSRYPDIKIESNDGILFFVDDMFNGSQYAIHFKNDFEKEIYTTEENGIQILEFDVHYQSPFTSSAIMLNGNLVANLPMVMGFETISLRIEISSDSTFTLDLTAIM